MINIESSMCIYFKKFPKFPLQINQKNVEVASIAKQPNCLQNQTRKKTKWNRVKYEQRQELKKGKRILMSTRKPSMPPLLRFPKIRITREYESHRFLTYKNVINLGLKYYVS